ncbi:serine hydrolase domain-containing protein [Arthrobacter sp. StoSoilB22]|uniref:serine hydrolase n=1 Tax=Arthrobacter sp. StoSoilB22 TaxID=2830996 RepID=UPI001CC51F73|nr:serine hydrolase domain-containing protein [Arthrobacter sp. StoSoilB22]
MVASVLAGCTSPGPSPSRIPSLSPSFGDAEAIASLDYAMQAFMDQDVLAVLAQVRWQPAQPKDRVPVASVTKTMTAISVLKLVDDGLIALDYTVKGFLESFGAGLKPPVPIALRQLLSHTPRMPAYVEAMFRSVDDFVSASNRNLTALWAHQHVALGSANRRAIPVFGIEMTWRWD